MGIDAHVPCGPTEALPLAVGYMLLRLWIPILLRHPKINHMNQVRIPRPRPADEEVIGFDVPVNKTSFVDGLDAGDLETQNNNKTENKELEGMKLVKSFVLLQVEYKRATLPFVALSCIQS